MTHHALTIETQGKGLIEFTGAVQELVSEVDPGDSMCTLFVRHTSASLTIQENADPSAKRDLEAWIERFVPEGDPHYTHTSEGPDDMPSHIKSVLTSTSLTIPVIESTLALGTWQGIYLWEHRSSSHTRTVIVSLA